MHSLQRQLRHAPYSMLFRAIVLLAFLAVSDLSAQLIPFTNYNNKNGLPQNTVNGICQDEEGYIWFATQVGAARFDGYDFENFSVSDGLPNNFINCLLSAGNGRMWFGTEGGLASYDGQSFTNYNIINGLVDNRVDRLEEDAGGNIWAMTAYGLSVITADTIYSFSKKDALSDNLVKDWFVDSRQRVHVSTYPKYGITIFNPDFTYEKDSLSSVVSDILEMPEGQIWYATHQDGIRVYDGMESTRLSESEVMTDLAFLSIMKDSGNRVWCATYQGGIFLWENGRFSKPFLDEELNPVVVEMHEDSKGRIWFVDYENGVWIFDTHGFRNINAENGLAANIVLDLFEDSFGNIWLGTLEGASKYGRVVFEIFDEQHGLTENNVLSVFMDSRDRLWIGTYGGLQYMKDGYSFPLGESHDYKEDSSPFTFEEDVRGNVFVGTDMGLMRFDGRRLKTIKVNVDSDADHPLEPVYFGLMYASDHTLWCGTDRGLFLLKEDEMESFGLVPGTETIQLKAFEQAGMKIYGASDNGIYVFDMDGSIRQSYRKEDGLPSNNCNDICGDSLGNIWVATDLGLVRISGIDSSLRTFGAEEGLSTNAIYFLHMQGDRKLWLGSEKGLYRFNTLEETTRYYGIEEGFYPLETNQGAISPGQGEELWMGTVEGLVHYMPEYEHRDLQAPRLILHDPLVDGKRFSAEEDKNDERPVFSYQDNNLDFSFTGIHTTIPARNRFSYFLEGYDEGWSEPSLKRTVPYRNLPSGEYIFRIRSYNLDGVMSSVEPSFSFAIEPPFWKTVWFIFLEVLAGISLFYGIIKIRERQLIKEKRVLEARVRERTNEIEDQKVEIEAQRDEIIVQNKEITDSIHYAKHIQQAVLPGKAILEQALKEHFILFRPRDIVSGDFYWIEQVKDRIIVCVADCTGHGVPGAFMSMLGLTFLSEIVNKDDILKADEILNRLRAYIVDAMTMKDHQARDGMDLSLVVIDPQLNIMEYAGAYNSLVMVRNGVLEEYKADKMPIGRHEGVEKSFTRHKISLEDGDMIYMFSDGFPDQFGGEKGGKYKAKPFKRFLQSISEEKMERQNQLIEMELHNWMGNHEQVDDILVMGIRYNTKT